MNAWLYCVGAAGLVVVLVMSHAAAPLRRVLPHPIGLRGRPEGAPTLLTCCLCTGVWVGWAVGAWAYYRGVLPTIPDVGIFGFAVAIVAYAFGTWFHEHDRPTKENSHDLRSN